jgi:predicted molibdopterin-dependent oxidoreductase YjgC
VILCDCTQWICVVCGTCVHATVCQVHAARETTQEIHKAFWLLVGVVRKKVIIQMWHTTEARWSLVLIS